MTQVIVLFYLVLMRRRENHAAILGKVGKEEIGLWGDEEGHGVYIRDRTGNIRWRAP